MDPEATLKNAEQAVRDGDAETAEELLEYYVAWRQRGGYAPKNGDKRARAIGRAIGRAVR